MHYLFIFFFIWLEFLQEALFYFTVYTTRPFRYDLNQIPYDYIVEMTNRFKGLDLIDRVPEELWMEVHDIVQEAVIETISRKKKMQKGKMAV